MDPELSLAAALLAASRAVGGAVSMGVAGRAVALAEVASVTAFVRAIALQLNASFSGLPVRAVLELADGVDLNRAGGDGPAARLAAACICAGAFARRGVEPIVVVHDVGGQAAAARARTKAGGTTGYGPEDLTSAKARLPQRLAPRPLVRGKVKAAGLDAGPSVAVEEISDRSALGARVGKEVHGEEVDIGESLGQVAIADLRTDAVDGGLEAATHAPSAHHCPADREDAGGYEQLEDQGRR